MPEQRTPGQTEHLHNAASGHFLLEPEGSANRVNTPPQQVLKQERQQRQQQTEKQRQGSGSRPTGVHFQTAQLPLIIARNMLKSNGHKSIFHWFTEPVGSAGCLDMPP
jgi:hypothetical protein